MSSFKINKKSGMSLSVDYDNYRGYVTDPVELVDLDEDDIRWLFISFSSMLNNNRPLEFSVEHNGINVVCLSLLKTVMRQMQMINELHSRVCILEGENIVENNRRELEEGLFGGD